MLLLTCVSSLLLNSIQTNTCLNICLLCNFIEYKSLQSCTAHFTALCLKLNFNSLVKFDISSLYMYKHRMSFFVLSCVNNCGNL